MPKKWLPPIHEAKIKLHPPAVQQDVIQPSVTLTPQ